jgi:hypothetical protein
MNDLHVREPRCDADIDLIQDKIDLWYADFLKLFSDSGTPYLHLLFSSEIAQMMKRHGGSIASHQQQSWEQLMDEVKRILRRLTTGSGGKQSVGESLYPFLARKIFHFISNGELPNMINPEASSSRPSEWMGLALKEWFSKPQKEKDIATDSAEEDIEDDECTGDIDEEIMAEYDADIDDARITKAMTALSEANDLEIDNNIVFNQLTNMDDDEDITIIY